MIIVADTSAMFAAFDAEQSEHQAARAVMEREALIVSPLVVAELDHLVHRDLGFPAATQVVELKQADLVAAQLVRAKYEGLRLDLADAVGVVLADRYKTDCIFALDQRDFRAVEPLTAGLKAFRILPAGS